MITSKQLKNLYKSTGKKPTNIVIKKDSISGKATLEGRCIKFIFSSDSKDRENDIINPKGIDFKNFMKNPVILWGHDSSQLPVGKCEKIEVVGKELHGTVRLWDEDMPIVGEKCEAIYRILQEGVLGTSIGFIPKEYEFTEDGGIFFNKIELAETSIVSVPCNQDALILEVGKEEEPDESDEDEGSKDIENLETKEVNQPEEVEQDTPVDPEVVQVKKDTSVYRARQLKMLGIEI